jgi:hypothetical protein
MDSGTATATGARAGRYRRGNNSSKFIWIGFCVLLTAGLVGAGIFGSKFLKENFNKDKKDDVTDAKGSGSDAHPTDVKAPIPKTASNAFPRRLLYISISKYMYLNPLTASNYGIDLTKPAAQRIAFDWRIPQEKDNNQLFILSDTLGGAEMRLPMKNIVQAVYTEFFKTSRPQDRIAIYFGGHAIEKDGKAYLAPLEGEIEGEDWEKSLIPLEHFYSEMQKCKAAQKVVMWDVCRFNPEKGRVRPGSEPMSEALFKALGSPPAGVQAIVSCKNGENAIEYTNTNSNDKGGNQNYKGSFFLESMKYIAEPRNNRLPKTTPKPEDPLPIAEWTPAIAKRAVEMAALVSEGNSKQTVTLHGTGAASLPAPNSDEKVAARFEFPQSPKPVDDIKSVEREFFLPPLKPGLNSIGLADFPFSADVMKPYENDVSFDEIMKNKEKYAFRVAVLESLEKIRKYWAPGAGTTKIRDDVRGPFDDAFKRGVKSEQEFWAIGIIELENELDKLKLVAGMRESEPKRWQAHYDFALASVKARYAYMNEYNKVLGNIITETLPALDTKLGQDGYVLVASETLKSGKDIKKHAEEAAELFQDISVKYKGTPWAIQAKQEKSVQIGLAWKPASLEKK